MRVAAACHPPQPRASPSVSNTPTTRYAAGRLSCEEVVLAFCERALICGEKTNAVTEEFYDQALDEARALDKSMGWTPSLAGMSLSASLGGTSATAAGSGGGSMGGIGSTSTGFARRGRTMSTSSLSSIGSEAAHPQPPLRLLEGIPISIKVPFSVLLPFVCRLDCACVFLAGIYVFPRVRPAPPPSRTKSTWPAPTLRAVSRSAASSHLRRFTPYLLAIRSVGMRRVCVHVLGDS
jgi:hypothetical protein